MNSTNSSLYAVIDLGSNSFHMLIVRPINDGIQTLAKIKRKVRLAAGLNTQNVLSQEAMQRGWDCLSLFAERLQDIPPHNIRIVGTATLRVAVNAEQFLQKANQILGHDINIISGEEEAKTIYHGVVHTSGGIEKQLIVDIGGASTELVIGEGFNIHHLTSLKMGCVTWLEHYFTDHQLNSTNFNQAIEAAKQTLIPILTSYLEQGWSGCVGASGTVQALREVMLVLEMNDTITLTKLQRIQKKIIQANQLELLDLDGLTAEQALVFPSGVAILIAIFESLNIQSMTVAGGALREGLLYSMLDDLYHNDDVRNHTIKQLHQNYHIDKNYAQQVSRFSLELLQKCGGKAWINDPIAETLLMTAAQLHEIGLMIDYKSACEHGAYLLQNINQLPGYSHSQKYVLSEIIRRSKGRLYSLPQQHVISHANGERILRLLRLAILLTHRRNPHSEPEYWISIHDEQLILSLKRDWLESNPLTYAELETEANRQTDMGWPLVLLSI